MDPTLYKARNMYLVRSRHYDVGKALGFGNGGWNGSAATIEAMKAFGYGTATPDPRLELTYYTGRVVVNGQEVINSETGNLWNIYQWQSSFNSIRVILA